MYLSSMAMTRVKTRPWPLSQVRVTGWPGDSSAAIGLAPFAVVVGHVALAADPAEGRRNRDSRCSWAPAARSPGLLGSTVSRYFFRRRSSSLRALEQDGAVHHRRVDGDPRAARLQRRFAASYARAAAAMPGSAGAPAAPRLGFFLVASARPGAPVRPSSPAWRRNTARRTAPRPQGRWPEGHSCCCSWRPLNGAWKEEQDRSPTNRRAR